MLKFLQFLTVLLSAIGVALLVLGAGRSLLALKVRRRLVQQDASLSLVRSTPARSGDRRSANAVINMLSRLSVPQKGWRDSALRLRFVRAGWRQENAPRVYFAIKTALVIGTALLASGFMQLLQPDAPWSRWLLIVLGSALGMNFLPDLYLRSRTEQRANTMQSALPDFLDLLVICTESGLGMDAAIGKVARDMAPACPALSEEFYIMALEIRAGESRQVALRNLAMRVDLEDIRDLVSMLIQADRFGTSLAVSLRIQSEVMRQKRLQRAEEIAAKIPTKMLLPLVGFIFPVLLMVLLGPAVIQIGKAFV